MRRFLLLAVTIVLTLVGCGTKSPQDLFEESKSGVVLILNEYYYTLTLPNGNTMYFTGLDSDGSLENLTFERKEIEGKCQAMTGTGFFVDRDGTIMTNRHVAQPQIDKAAVKNSYNQMISYIKAYYTEQMSQLSQAYSALEDQKSLCYTMDYYGNNIPDEERLQQIAEQQSELESQFNEMGSVRDQLDDNVSLDELKISSVCVIGIAYNNTFVSSVADFVDRNPCVVVRVSDKDNVDLALLKLKSGKTPDGAHIFNTDGSVEKGIGGRLAGLFGKNDDKALQIDQQLYMIGYNAGPQLANTRRGIQVQMTSGKVTQLPDGERVLYSIPTVQGSSGSPVVSESGALVAVNFAKLVGSDNFNFGIPLNRVEEFMKGN